MKQLTPEQFKNYMSSSQDDGDAKVRKWANIPDDKYYTVSVWPDHLSGQVRVNPHLHRTVHAKKISKSDQQ